MLSVRTLRIRLKDSIHLTWAAICAFLFGTSAIIMIYFNYIGNASLFFLFQKITIIPFLSIFFAGYFYYEAFITIRPPLSRLIPMLAFYVFVFTFDLFNIFIFNSELLNAFAFMITFYFATIFHIFASNHLSKSSGTLEPIGD